MRTKTALALLVLTLAHAPVCAARAQGNRASAGAPAAGRYHALVIGNNTYASLPRLKTAEADARAVERLLREDYGFQTKLLLNATRQQIVSALTSYRRGLSAADNLLVYYAGHGYNDAETGRAYWLPVDATRDDYSNWISADDITAGIRAVPARHVLVVADSCYSGTLTRGLGDLLPRPAEREQFLQRMLAGKSRTLMASGGDEPVADGGGGDHSVFAAAFLRGLRQMDKAQFTAAELYRSYVEERVAGKANQTPEYNPLRNSGHEAGDFVFAKLRTQGAGGGAAAPATVDPAAFELSYWDSIKNSTDPEDFQAYLERYPNGQFANLARRRAQAKPATREPAATQKINVKVRADSANNGWTYTGLMVTPGMRIRITAAGTISLGNGVTCTPAGVTTSSKQRLLPGAPLGTLVAVIGDNNDEFLHIGSAIELTSKRYGALFLGVNEEDLSDNSGAFDVEVEVISSSSPQQ